MSKHRTAIVSILVAAVLSVELGGCGESSNEIAVSEDLDEVVSDAPLVTEKASIPLGTAACGPGELFCSVTNSCYRKGSVCGECNVDRQCGTRDLCIAHRCVSVDP